MHKPTGVSRIGPALPRLSRLGVFIAGAVLGLALWAVPALLGNEPLPWDSQGPVYAVALLIIGFVLGLVGPGQFVAGVIGLFIGQLVVLLARVIGNPATSGLWLVSAMLLAGYTVVAGGIGAVLGDVLRRRLDPVRRGRERRSG